MVILLKYNQINLVLFWQDKHTKTILYVCMYVYICVHVCVCICIYTHICTHANTFFDTLFGPQRKTEVCDVITSFLERKLFYCSSYQAKQCIQTVCLDKDLYKDHYEINDMVISKQGFPHRKNFFKQAFWSQSFPSFHLWILSTIISLNGCLPWARLTVPCRAWSRSCSSKCVFQWGLLAPQVEGP